MLDTNSVIKKSSWINYEILTFIKFDNNLIYNVSYSHLLMAVYFICCTGGDTLLWNLLQTSATVFIITELPNLLFSEENQNLNFL